MDKEWKIKLIRESIREPHKPYQFENGNYYAIAIYHFEWKIIGKRFKDDKFIKDNVCFQNVQARTRKGIEYYRKWSRKFMKNHIKNYAIEDIEEDYDWEYGQCF